MNTPAHVVTGLWLLSRPDRPTDVAPIAIGGLLPDAPMFVFYAVEKARGMTEASIWSSRYFDDRWQLVFDLFNSLPLIAVAIAIGWFAALPRLVAGAAAMGVHALTDLPLHHDDGHRHFLPFSGWRFESPVSYWDPTRSGGLITVAEIALVTFGCVALWRRFPERSTRWLVAATGAIYGIYFAYVAIVWL